MGKFEITEIRKGSNNILADSTDELADTMMFECSTTAAGEIDPEYCRAHSMAYSPTN